ncbi:MAG: response regulator transcription factor [Ruminococcaceae bacterium]|nr:response regulator transcription factor [Oscillospiraceae bacterium]MBQ8325164.1 response regulator transcription factor [Clostridia bacterium]
MTYRIALCDDEPAQREYLTNLVRTWAAEAEVCAEITAFSSGEALLFGKDGQDIFLLDIEMPGMDGIALAEALRKTRPYSPIVFITGYDRYLAKGYDVAALHYLLKPVVREKLFSVLSRAVEQLGQSERMLTLEAGGEIVRLPLREIAWVEVQGNYVTFHGKETHKAKMTLAEAEARLDSRFCRTGRSFLVNLHHVRKVAKTEVCLASGEKVPLSRGMYEAVNRALISNV